jgi:hypothetical protein
MAVRGIPGRVWHVRKRCWSIPKRLVGVAVEDFAAMGLRVAVDGEVQHTEAINPFAGLKAAMDQQTWCKVSAALEGVLDPASGGDPRLHTLLRRTERADQPARAS